MYEQFSATLLNSLPMDDASFIEELYSHNLLSDEVKDLMKSQPAQVDMATTFLKHVIEPSVTSGDGSNFNKLLEIMEESGHDNLKELAKQIRTSSTKGAVNTDGDISGT